LNSFCNDSDRFCVKSVTEFSYLLSGPEKSGQSSTVIGKAESGPINCDNFGTNFR